MVAQTRLTTKSDISEVIARLEQRGAKQLKRHTNAYSVSISFRLKGGPKHTNTMRDLAIAMTQGTGWTYEAIGELIGGDRYCLQICPEGTL